MTLITNTAEGGTAGVVVTTANSGGSSGTAFSTVTAGHTTFSSAAAGHGGLGYELTAASGSGYVALGGTGTGPFAAQAYVRFSSLPSGTNRHRFLSVMNTAGTYFVLALDLTPTGAIEVTSSSGFIATAGASLNVNSWYRVQVTGTSGTTGTARLIVQPASGGTTLIDQTWTRDMTTNLGSLMVLGQTLVTPVSGFQFDDLSFQPDDSTVIAANPIAATAATVAPNAGLDFTVHGSERVSLIANGYDQSNGVYNKGGTWSQVSGPAVSLTASTSSDGVSMVSFTAPKALTAQSIVLRLTQAGPNGVSASDDVTVTVSPWQRWVSASGAVTPAHI